MKINLLTNVHLVKASCSLQCNDHAEQSYKSYKKNIFSVARQNKRTGKSNNQKRKPSFREMFEIVKSLFYKVLAKKYMDSV